mgnify:FL=1|tara:strand:- start:920 stop:1615 length:696 start_codon:yes stop_codon:yes gene_type:complete
MMTSPRWQDFENIDSWIFDLDNTLYPSATNLFARIDKKMGEFISTLLQIDLLEAKKLQKSYFHEHGTTLRGLMQVHRINPTDFLEYVHDIDVSDLAAAPELGAALEKLPGKRIIFTNGSLFHAKNVSTQLGIDHHFHHIFDIAAADYLPKPHKPVYEKLVKEFDINPERAVLFEDMAVNLAPAHDMGMKTVWIPNDRYWSADGGVDAHIHYKTDDLGDWLTRLLDDRNNGT